MKRSLLLTSNYSAIIFSAELLSSQPNLKYETYVVGARVAQAVSDYGLDDQGSIPDRGRGLFF
jgi:hypothetical protein